MEALALIGDLGLNVVDDAEIARCKKYFTFYDEDKDGKLTYAELLSCLRVCGRNPSISEFKEMVTEIDSKLVRASRTRTARADGAAQQRLLFFCAALLTPPTTIKMVFAGRRAGV